MFAEAHVGDVLKFVAILRVMVKTRAAPAVHECPLDLDSRSAVQGILSVISAHELKARFVNGASAEDLSVAQLESMLCVKRDVSHGRQSKGANAVSRLVVAPILVARRERVSRIDLIIQALAEVRSRARGGSGIRI